MNSSDRARALEQPPNTPHSDSSAAGARREPRADAAPPHAAPRVLIKSEESGVQLNLGDWWAYRELLYFLTLRDVKVRYKQTALGAAWVIVQPLFMMLIVTLVFNRFARVGGGELPYPLFAYAGLLIWVFFSNAVVNGTNSLTANTNLITKVYFPRIFIPAAAVAAGLVDLCIASLVLAALAVYYGVGFHAGLLLLPFFVLLATLLALGAGVLVSALTVKYRDLRHALPFVIQFLMFASPVIYPPSIVPENWRWLLVANPLAGILEGFRSALTGRPFDWPAIAVAALMTTVLLVVSVYAFRRTEDTFADVI